MLKFTFVLLISFLVSKSYSQNLDLLPGMYNLKTQVIVNGKDFNQDANYKKMMAEQKKAMTPEVMEQMKKMGIALPTLPDMNRIEVCIKPEELTPEGIRKTQDNKKCKYKTLKHTSKEMDMTFKCLDGAEAKSVMKILNKKQFTSYTITKNPKKAKNQTTEMKSKGQWVSAKCSQKSMDFGKGVFNNPVTK